MDLSAPLYETKKEPNNLRALFVYDTDKEIDEQHPLWKEIQLYGEKVSELHLIVFIKHPREKYETGIKLGPTIFVYYIPSSWLLFRLQSIWSMVKMHLVWKKSFRPYFILNFSTGWGSSIGFFLAWYYRRMFFSFTSGSFLELPWYTSEYVRLHWIMRYADGIFVPGQKVSDVLSARVRVSNEKITIIRPALDLATLDTTAQYLEYSKKYPQHNIFLVSRLSLSHRRGLTLLLGVYTDLVLKYPRTALIIIVPAAQVGRIEQIVKTKGFKGGIYLYAEKEESAFLYRGATLLLSTSEVEEINMPVVTALKLQVPVVTTPAGVAKEIFADSRYKDFMCLAGDRACFVKMASLLIEDQYVRNDYRLNSSLLLNSLTLHTPAERIAMIMANIEESIK